MSSALPRHPGSGGSLSIIIVGNDALIEALPALPLQVAHACLAAGYDQALPLSWGDELVAEATLRSLEQRPGEPAILCVCPFVRQRLLGTGGELEPMLLEMPAPPVAVARYVRFLYGDRIRTLTYLGRCPSGRSAEFDVTLDPALFFAQLRTQGIDATAQPEFFEGVLPPDRRRFVSLPGGCPTPEALWRRANERTLIELEERDLAVELAQRLVERKSMLVDLAPGLGCACSGVTPTTTARSARVAVMSLEPPRANAPVVEAPSDLVELERAGARQLTTPEPAAPQSATPQPNPLSDGRVAEGPAIAGPMPVRPMPVQPMTARPMTARPTIRQAAPAAATSRPPTSTSPTRTNPERPRYAVTPPRALRAVVTRDRPSTGAQGAVPAVAAPPSQEVMGVLGNDAPAVRRSASRGLAAGPAESPDAQFVIHEPRGRGTAAGTMGPSLSRPRRHRQGLWASRALLPRFSFSRPTSTVSRVPRAFLLQRASVHGRRSEGVASPDARPSQPSVPAFVVPRQVDTIALPPASATMAPSPASATIEPSPASATIEPSPASATIELAPASADDESRCVAAAPGPVYTVRPRRSGRERSSVFGIMLPVSCGVVLLAVVVILLMVR